MVAFNLSSPPPELKPIAPFLQRANELKSQEPIISYWCAYYAAQQGIGLKVQETISRNFLFDLLGALESMKKDIGRNDTIEDESASSAYVENFALKVFGMADNEDRSGEATRGTAKKFLAAAHFLEILSTFEASKASDGVTDNANTEKIRYAKWKAADIAKAFREGRKPIPGPADSAEDDLEVAFASFPQAPAINIASIPDTPLAPPPHAESPSSSTAPPRTYSLNLPPASPFPPSSPSNPPPVNSAYLNPDGFNTDVDPKTPSSWSTVATPGTPGVPKYELDDVVDNAKSIITQKVWVSGELEGRNSDSEIEEDGMFNAPHRPNIPQSASSNAANSTDTTGSRFSPSTAEGSSSVSTTPATSAEIDGDLFEVAEVIQPPVTNAGDLPPGFISTIPPQLPPPPPVLSSRIPPRSISSIVPPSRTSSHVRQQPMVPAPPVPEPETLTPAVISKAQRHCKFAISALDYEDAETARKELRAALAILGG